LEPRRRRNYDQVVRRLELQSLGFELLESRLMLSGASPLDYASLVAVPFAASPSAQLASPSYVTLDYAGTSIPATGNSPVGNGLNPTQILGAYGINKITFGNGTIQGNGAGQTIAIVDAYNDPTIAADLATFDTAFGLPAPPSFSVVSQTGSTTVLPVGDTGWAVEESLDVEWSHAIAPQANIILVEGNSNSFSDLNTAVLYAAAQPGVSVVSMSYGSGEYSSETANDSIYTTPTGHIGVTFLASTGDSGEPGGYQAYSPNVVAVGGTTLGTDSAGDYLSESGWSGSGGGISAYESQPAYQKGTVTQSTTQRTIPDISFDADPSTGPAIIDSYTYGTTNPWTQIGGTSFAAPSWAALISIADQGRVAENLGTLDGPTQTLPMLYSLPSSDFHDITTGYNGYSAGVGYDLVTGRGTPIANLLVPDLIGNMTVVSSTPAAGSVISTTPSDFLVQFSTAYDPTTVQASEFLVNGIAATSYTLTSANSITFHFTQSGNPVSPVTTLGLQSESLSGINDLAHGNAMNPFSANFRYDPHPITVVSTTPAVNSVVSLPLTTLNVTFSEPYLQSSISTSNLTLSVGTVTGYTLLPATNSVAYTLSGITQEGTTGLLSVSMAYGAVTDPQGDPLQQAFSGTYTLDIATTQFPTPLTSTGGVGSLIAGQSIPGSIGFVGDTDSYTLNLDAGQTLTLVSTAGATLQPSLSLLSPGGTTIASASSAAAGQAAVLQTATISTTGTYTFVVSGLASTTGTYTLQAYVNAAVETELYNGPTNNSQATAQDLTASFIGLAGSAARGAVLGTLAGSTDQDWYSFSLNAGDSIGVDAKILNAVGALSLTLWNSSGTQLATSVAPAANFDQAIGTYVAQTSGRYYVQVTSTSNSQYSLVLMRDADIGNQTNNTIATAQQLDGAQINGELVALGNVSGSVIESFDNPNSLSAYTNGIASGDTISAAAAHDGSSGLATSLSQTWIYRTDVAAQVQQGETFSVWVNPAASTPSGRAYFGFGASATNTLSVVIAPNTNQLILQEDPSYTLFNQLAAVAQTYVPNQWYKLQVVWGTGGAITANLYGSDGVTLLNTVSATDTNVASGGLSFRGFGSTYDFDTVSTNGVSTPTYSVPLLSGSTLSVSTSTPGDGISATANTFDPVIEVFNHSGTLVASDDNSGADGRNAQLTYVVPTGAGGSYFIQVLASPLTTQPTTGDYVLAVQFQGGSANHAPVLNNSVVFGLSSVAGDTTSNLGNTISTLLAEGGSIPAVTDADPGAQSGIAITAVDASHGTWQFSTSGGASWTSINSVSTSLSLLLQADGVTRLRFIPNLGYSGTLAAGITFLAWDQTAGTNGGTIDTEVTGGTTAFSSASATASLVVTPGNLAPTLLGASNLSSQLENNSSSSGTLVKALISGQITDPDLNAAQGIAVTGANTASGSWQYSTSGSGGPWLSLGSVSTSSARLLAADNNTFVRFVPNSNFSGTVSAALTFRAWDQTSGSNGGLANTTSSGGASAFSLQSASTTLAVIPLGDTRSWIGGGPDNNWSDGANWVGGVAPSAGDSLVFAAAALQYTSVDDFAAGTAFNSITLLGSGYSITGNGVTLASGFVANNTTGSNSFTAPITLATAQTLDDANAAATLTLGAINTGVLQLLTIDGAGTISIGGAISGSGGITKNGSGTLILSGSNTYLGITTINQGVVNVQSNSALGATTAGTTVGSGAALQVQGSVTIAEPLTLGGSGTVTGFNGLGALRSVGGTNNWTGNVLLSGTVSTGVDSGSLLNISGTVSSLQTTSIISLEEFGGGTLELSGTTANSIEGLTEVFQGTLLLAKSAGVTAVEGSVLIGDNLQGSNASVLRLGASGQIPQMDPTGTVLLNVTVNPSGLLDLNNFNDTIGNLSMLTGATFSANVATGSGLLTLGGSVTLSSAEGSSGASPAAVISGNLDLGSLGSFSGGSSAITTRVFSIGDTALANVASDLTISATISGSSGISLSKSGTGTLTLTGANTYASSTILSAGVVEVGNSSAFGAGLLSLDGATLRAVNGAQTLANPVTIDASFAVFGSSNLTFTSPATLTGARTITVLDSIVATFSGGLGEGVFSASSLTKAGSGTLALTGANTYSGNTTINAGGGILALAGSGTVPYSPAITVSAQGTLLLDNSGTNNSDRVTDLATITLSGGTLDFVGASGAASTETLGAITLSTGTSSTIESDLGAGGGSSAVLSIASLATNLGASVNFVGTGAALSSVGSNQINIALSPAALTNGILPFATVTGPSGLDLATYLGTSAGVAMIALPAADYVTSLAAAGPTSNVKLSSSDTSNGKMINALLVVGSGVNVGGASDTLTVSSGAVAFAGGGTNTLSVGNLVLPAQAFITTDPGSTATVSGVVTGAATSFTKAGTGTLVLSGANQFAGADYINGGMLTMQNSAALGGASGAATVNSGATLALQDPGGSPIVVGAKSLTITGTGYNNAGALLSISGNSNSWAGTIAMNSVSIDGPALFPAAAVVVTGASLGANAGQLTLSGQISGSSDLIKVGAGTVQLSGVASNTYTGSTRIVQGILLLDKSPGLNAVGSSVATIWVGNDQASASPGEIELGANYQGPAVSSLPAVQVGATGIVNFNNFTDSISSLILTIGPNGGSTVMTGSGTMTATGSITVQAIGTGNPSPATISGNLALETFGTTGSFGHSITVNDGAIGDDLVISASISDGTGLASQSVTKLGLGTLQFTGTAANTYTGATTVSEGTLELNKSSGVNAFAGSLSIGSGLLSGGGANSEVVRLLNNNQTPSAMAPVSILSTGLFDLNGYNDTIGGVAGTAALTMTSGNITTGTGTLTLNGEVTINNTTIQSATISGMLNLGSSSRTFSVAHFAGDATDLIISATISGAAGIDLNKTGTGTLLLTGNNTYAGRTYLTAGTLAIGSDSALGTGTLFMSAGSIQAYASGHIITNTVFVSGTMTVSGANPLTFSGAVNLTAATTISVTNPINVNFSAGIGETVSGTAFTKSGAGFVTLTGLNTYSGTTTVSAGWLTLKDFGADINTSSIIVSSGATLRIDNNSAANLTDRISDTANVTLNGGTLLFIGAPGIALSETIGTLTLGSNFGSTVISQASTTSGSSVNLTFGQLTRNNYSTVSFIGAGVDLGATNQIDFTTAPTETGSGANAILPYATVVSTTNQGRVDLATLRGLLVTAFTAYATGNINSAAAGSNYLLDPAYTTSPQTLTSTLSLNAVLIRGSNQTITSSAGNTLNIASGALVTAGGGTGNTISVTTLDFGANEGILNTSADLAIFSTITGTSPIGLTKAGSNTFTLSGNNTYSGQTVIDQGVVSVQNSGALGATVANAVQTVTITNATGGTFELYFNGVYSSTMNWNASAATVQSTLNAMSTIGGIGGSVTVTNPNSSANPNVYTITFGGTLAGFSQPGFGYTYSFNYVGLLTPSLAISTVVSGGTAGAGTVVTAGAALQLAGNVSVSGEQLTLNGAGVNSTGALQGLAGTNTWNGDVSINATTILDVDPGDQLNLGGAIGGGVSTLTKIGTGVVQYSGATPNTYVGTTTVSQGTLILNKTAGVPAITGFGGSNLLFVGDDVDQGTGTLQFAAAEQLTTLTGVTIASTGSLQELSTVGTSTTQAVQWVQVSAGSTGNGTFTMTYGASTTSSLSYTTTPAALQTALNGLSSISGGGGSVSVTGTVGNYYVQFTGTLANTAVSTMTITPASNATGSVIVISVGGGTGTETISGSGLTLAEGIVSSSAVSIATGTALTLNASVTVNAALPGLAPTSPGVTISGGSLGLALSSTSAVRTFTINDGPVINDLVITSTIIDGSGSTTSALSKGGNGRLVLNPTSASNTYGGTTTISAGQINIQQAGELGTADGTTTTEVIVSSGGALELAGVSVGNKLLSLSGSGSTSLAGTATGIGALVSTSGTNSWAGNIVLAATSTIAVATGAPLTLSGAISGSGFGITKILPGTLMFSGSSANTYSGTTSVNEGTLILNKTAGVDAILGPLTVGNDAGGGSSDLVQLAGANQIDTAAAVTIDSNGWLDLNGNAQTFGNTASTILTMEYGQNSSAILSTEAGTLTLGGASGVSGVVFNGAGLITTSAPAALISGNLNLGTGTRTFTVNASGAMTNNAQISAAITGSGTGALTKAGTGTLLLSASNSATYSGQTTLSAGTIALGNNNALGTGGVTVSAAALIRADGGPITLPNAITMSSTLTLSGNQNLSLGGAITVTGNSFSLTVANSATTTIGSVSIATSGNTWFVNTDLASTVTLAGSVTSAGNFEKSGVGRLTVTGALNVTGTNFLFAGVLAVSNHTQLGTAVVQVSSGSALEISGSDTFTNQVNLNDSATNDLDAGSNGFFTGALRSTSGTNVWSGLVVLNGNVGTSFIGVDSGQLTLSNVISGFAGAAQALTKVGAGTLVMSGSSSNTYTGLTTVDQGTLVLNKSGSANAINTGGIVVGDGGGGRDSDLLQYGSAGGTDEIADTASVTVYSSGKLDLGTNSASDTLGPLTLDIAPGSSADVATGTGTLTLAGGFVALNSSGATDSNTPAATISGTLGLGTFNEQFTINGTQIPSMAPSLLISAAVTGSSSATLTLLGTGTLQLTGADSYSGATVIDGGTLALAGAGSILNSTFVSVYQGATLLLDNTGTNLGNRVSDSGLLMLVGGTFSFIGQARAVSSETIGTLEVDAGLSNGDAIVQSTVSGIAGSSVAIIFAGLTQPPAGTVQFVGVGGNFGSANNQLFFTNTPTLTGGIIPAARLESSNGLDFVTYGAANGIAAASYVTSLAAAGPNDNVILSANETLTGSKSVNAILFTNANVTANLAGFTLTVNSGVLAARSTGDAIAAGTLALAAQGVVTVDSADDLTISSMISGSGGLVKNGVGTLALSGANTYSGETQVSQGTLRIQSGLALGATGTGNDTTVFAGATLAMQGSINVGDETLTLAGTGVNNAGALESLIGTNTWGSSGTVLITLGPYLALGTLISSDNVGVASGQLILNGTLSGVALTEVGSGTLQLAGSASNTFVSAITVDAGLLQLNKLGGVVAVPGSLTVGDGVGIAQVQLLGSQQIATTQALTVNRGAQFDLQGFSQSLTGVTISDGTVTNSGGGGTLTLSGASPIVFNGGTLNSGAGSILLANTASTVTANAADAATIAGNMTLGTGTATFNVADGPAVDDLVISAAVSGQFGITKSGAGTLLMSAANSYSGTTTLSAGGLAVGSSTAVGTGKLNISGGTLRGDGGNQTLANPISVSGSFTLGGRRDLAGTNTGIDLTTAQATSITGNTTIAVADPLVLAEIAGSLVQASSGYTLTKSGDGTLILAGNNNYSGTTTVSAGVLNIQNSGALGSGTVSVTSGAAIQLQGNLTIGNQNLTLNGNGFVGDLFGTGESTGALHDISGTSTWGTGTTTITLSTATYLGADSGGNLILNGTVSGGTNTLNKVGLGTVQLAGSSSNSLTGTTTIYDGTLRLNKSGGATAMQGPLVIGDNVGSGTDTVQELAAQQLPDSGSVTVTVNSTGLWDLSQIATNSSAVQTITITGAPTGGTFTLTYNGQTTTPLAYNAPTTGTGSVQSALQNLTNIGTNNVSVSGTAGSSYIVTFQSALAGQYVPTMTASSASLTGGTSSTIGVVTTTAGGVGQTISGTAASSSTNANVLTLVVGQSQSGSVSTGSSMLALDGVNSSSGGASAGVLVSIRSGITTAVPATISGNLALVAGQQSATRAFTVTHGPGANDLVVSASIVDGTLPGNIITTGTGLSRIVFAGNNSYSGKTTVSTGVLNVQSSTGLGTPLTSAEQSVTFTGASSGTFTLTFGGVTTAAIAYNALASVVQADLAALTSIGAGNVNVTSSGPGSYAILFQGSLAGFAETTMTTSGLPTTPVTVATIVAGGVGTSVTSGAALELQGGINIAAEPLTLAGTGPSSANSTAIGATNAGTGALRNIANTNTWGGNIVLTATSTVGIDAGQLTLGGLISGSNFGLTEVGGGTLVLAGSAANTYSGTTTVNAGTLILHDTVGVAMNGSLVVGDGFGGQDAELVQFASGALSQIPSTATVTVAASGKLDLATGTGTNTISTLVLAVGPTSSADVITGTGSLTVATVTGIGLAGALSSTSSASVSGNLKMSANTPTFKVNRSGASDDVSISAAISGSTQVVKNGWGTLVLSNSNSFTGGLNLAADSGTVVVTADGALGAAGSAVTVNADSTLAFRGGVTYATSATITLNSSGATSTGALVRNGALDSLGGSNAFYGTVVLGSASTIAATSGNLIFNGSVSGAFPLAVNGWGSVDFNGNVSVTSTSVTNASLGGVGTFSGPVTFASFGGIAPGNLVVGVLNTAAITLNSNSTYTANLNGATAGTSYNQVSASGVVNLAGAPLVVNLGYVPSGGDSYTLVNSTNPIVGTFAGLPQGTVFTVAGIAMQILYSNDQVVLVADHAPAIASGGSPTLSSIYANETGNGGTLVSAIIASGGAFSDQDGGALQGIAVDGVNNASGNWQFSTNGGSSWTSFGAPSDLAARLLASDANTRVRFVPNANYTGTVTLGITFRAWDGTVGTNGAIADATLDGGAGTYSTATESASILVDAIPIVVGAFASGTNWGSGFYSDLDSSGLGDPTVAGEGFKMFDGANQLTSDLPWTSIDTISIAFSEFVNVGISSLTLYDSSNNPTSATSFSYDATNFIAHWTFPSSLAANIWWVGLTASTVTDQAGTQLDGDWTTGSSTFAQGSGNGTPGGDFNFLFNVLPGDVNNNGIVSTGDVLQVKTQLNATLGSNNYRQDINANGVVTTGDVLQAKTHLNTSLSQFPTPVIPPAAAPAASPTPDPSTSDNSAVDTSVSVTASDAAPLSQTVAISPTVASSVVSQLTTVAASVIAATPSMSSDPDSSLSASAPSTAGSDSSANDSISPATTMSPSESAANIGTGSAPTSSQVIVPATDTSTPPAATVATSASTQENSPLTTSTIVVMQTGPIVWPVPSTDESSDPASTAIGFAANQASDSTSRAMDTVFAALVSPRAAVATKSTPAQDDDLARTLIGLSATSGTSSSPGMQVQVPDNAETLVGATDASTSAATPSPRSPATPLSADWDAALSQWLETESETVESLDVELSADMTG
jgi:fibronectin-binding autotransporter adhesin